MAKAKKKSVKKIPATKSAKESSQLFHNIVEASVSNNPKKMKQPAIKNQIVEAIKKNHAEQIEKGEPVIDSYAGLHELLSHLHPDEINAAIAKMNSVKIIDGMAGSLEFFPNLF